MSVHSSKGSSGISAFSAEIRVCSAGTGDEAVIQLSGEEEPLPSFKRQVQQAFGIDAADQIILAGPPYKPLTSFDKWFSRSRTHSSRHEENIFVYNRKFFSKGADTPPPVVLEPSEIAVPSKGSVECSESVLAFCGSQNPLLSAVPSFEQRFKYEALKSEFLSVAAQEVRAHCGICFKRQGVQAEGLQAAVSNLNDYYETAKSNFRDTALQFRQLQYTHGELLASFDSNFDKLSQITLHKSLQAENRVTLMDCIPAEKVQQYKTECATKHARVEGLLDELEKHFEEVSHGVNACIENNATASGDSTQLERLLLVDLDGLVSSLTADGNEICHNHRHVKDKILEVIQNQPSEEGLRKAVPEMLSQLDTLLSDKVAPLARRMDENIAKVMEIKAAFEDSQTRLQEVMFATLRKVSQLQYTIQQITSYLTTLKRARPTQEEAFQHLEHIISLPSAYQGFLSEVMRRRLYLRVFETKVQTATDDLAEFRNQETKLRETFMQDHGRKLPPLFLELVPSLQEKPPYFSPSITQSAAQGLPEVTMEDVQQAMQQVSSVTLHSEESSKLRELLESWQRKAEAADEEDDGGSLIFNEDPAYSQNAQERYHDMEYQNSLLMGRVSSMSARIEQLEAQLRQSGVQNSGTPSENKEGSQPSDSVAPSAPEGPPEASGTHDHQEASELRQVCEALEAVIGEDPPLWGTLPDEDQSSEFARALGLITHVQTSAKDAVEQLRQQLRRTNAECERMAQQAGVNPLSPPKIAFREFCIGDVALFMPTQPHDPTIYVAFHMGCPHRYLSTHSLEAFKQQRTRSPEYVLGRIVFIESARATPDENPFNVPVGVEFFTLTVESIVRR